MTEQGKNSKKACQSWTSAPKKDSWLCVLHGMDEYAAFGMSWLLPLAEEGNTMRCSECGKQIACMQQNEIFGLIEIVRDPEPYADFLHEWD